jgi:beta-galactosidase GanA
MEQAPDIVHSGGWMVPKRPGQLTRLSLSHVARGSLGIMNFQWRASPGGAEAFMSAMVPYAGPDAGHCAKVAHLGAQLANLASRRCNTSSDSCRFIGLAAGPGRSSRRGRRRGWPVTEA